MSLTNPNKVVTEQRLNEYHNAILPYLGGMPEMVANKFSKGDLYSTEEKMIGQWIDGKPLYQKTFTGSSLTDGVNIVGTLTNVSVKFMNGFASSSIFNADITIPVFESNTVYIRVAHNTSNGNIAVTMTGYGTDLNNGYAITVKYTKTTDSAISIGSDTDYSTEEKIVGTWIDGKPIYQKTLSFTTSSGTTKQDINISIEHFINAYGFLIRGGNEIPLNRYFSNNNAVIEFSSMWCRNNNHASSPNSIGIYTTYSDSSPAIVTIQYTKTTD